MNANVTVNEINVASKSHWEWEWKFLELSSLGANVPWSESSWECSREWKFQGMKVPGSKSSILGAKVLRSESSCYREKYCQKRVLPSFAERKRQATFPETATEVLIWNFFLFLTLSAMCTVQPKFHYSYLVRDKVDDKFWAEKRLRKHVSKQKS